MDKHIALNTLKQLARIADALEVIALANAPKSPNFVRTIDEFQTFDWGAIGAEVVASDEYGVAQVRWGGYVWKRCAPDNKFAEAVWFSRPDGKDGDGSNKYVRLISFKQPTEAEPVGRKVEKIIGQPQTVIEGAPALAQFSEPGAPAAGPATKKASVPQNANGAKYNATKDARLAALAKPSLALDLADVPASTTLFWHLVGLFKIDRTVAADVLQEGRSDIAQAIRDLDRVAEVF